MKTDWIENAAHDKSFWLLALSNALTIMLAYMENWNFFSVFLIYWCQTMIIVFIGSLKYLTLTDGEIMAMNKNNMRNEKFRKEFEAAKFSPAEQKFYGFFGILLFLGGLAFFCLAIAVALALRYRLQLFQDLGIVFLIAIAFFAINHIVSFKSYWLGRKKPADPYSIRNQILSRTTPMILTAMFGFAFTNIMILFLLLKSLADMFSHINEHNGGMDGG